MNKTTALIANELRDTMPVVSNKDGSDQIISVAVTNMDLMEIGGCKIVLEFSKTPNPSIQETVTSMLIETFEERRDSE